MTEAQRVSQLFMVGVPTAAPPAAAEQVVRDYGVGGVLLYGGSDIGLGGVRAFVSQLQALAAPAAAGTRLYVAADQEGGQVQELQGPGFNAIPPGLAQGSQDPARLRRSAQVWGGQLLGAGVNVDLGPVTDVVPPSIGAANQPLGRYERELGEDPTTVATHGAAVVQGLQAAGVAATVKHFPGLGRVTGNTDVTAGVTDTVTTRHDPYLAPFAAGIEAGARFAMVSLATYSNIDPSQPGSFSPQVIRGMLRGDLGFAGLVISDDLGFAAQVQSTPPGQRAVDFLAAGGDVVLASRPPAVVTSMINAAIGQAGTDASFRELLDQDTLAVLQAKQLAGLLPCR
jgi:beta-N-acetylhexosaminidase